MQYIISGIAPGFGGVAKVIDFLQNNLNLENYIFIYPDKNSTNFQNILSEIENKDIIIVHPQSVGFQSTINLIKKNRTKMYIVDNSFFCVKSYNHLENTFDECLQCLEDTKNAEINDCQPFPRKYTREENLLFIKELKELAKNIIFLTLSNSSENLLKAFFGDKISTQRMSFLSEEILSHPQKEAINEVPSYDIVFHAADIEAKGFEYIQKLAKELPSCTFFIPTNKIKNSTSNNVTASYIQWDNGLKAIVERAKIVLTPSLWSYMPETATLKSFLFNGSVAIIDNNYGFSNDIPNDVYVHLTGNPNFDATVLRDNLSKKEYLSLKDKSIIYLDQYIQQAYEELSTELDFQYSLDQIIKGTSQEKNKTNKLSKVNLTKNINTLINNANALLKNDSYKYIIYGKGTIADIIYRQNTHKNITFIDNQSTLMSNDIQNAMCYNPKNLSNMDFDYIIISVLGREDEIKKYLQVEFNVPTSKILTINI